MNKNRPKGVVGQWYTLTSDFIACGGAKDRKEGYTWKCEEVDDSNEPTIEGIGIGLNETYRLATPEEIAIATGVEKPKTKPSKEAREFWERAFEAIVMSPRPLDEAVVELADDAMKEWQKRFE